MKVRPTQADNAAIAQFVTQFAVGNYGICNRTISVGIDPTCEATVEEVPKAIEENKESGMNFTLTALKNVRALVVDGAYRVEALRAPAQVPSSDRSRYLRRDKNRFLLSDFHTVGSCLNDIDRVGVRTSAFDRVNTFLSVYRDATQQSAAEVEANYKGREKTIVKALRENGTAGNLRKLVELRGIGDALGRVQRSKYCVVAMGLHRFPDIEEALLGLLDGKLGFNIMSNRVLWAANDVMQLRFLLCSVAHMHRAVPVGEECISNVVRKLTDFWSLVEEEFAKRGIASKDGFALDCKAAGRNAACEPLLTRMSAWVKGIRAGDLALPNAWATCKAA